MKTMVLAVFLLVLGILGFSGASQAGLWEKLNGMMAETVPSEMFAIEAVGYNLRGYMFVLESQNKICLFVTGEQKGGLDCWDSE